MAELLGQEEAVFVPTATMANEIALRTLAAPGGEVVAEENAHLFISELGGPAVHAGLMTRQLPCPNGRFTPEQLRATFRQGDRTHTPPTRIVSVENTHNASGGRVWPLEEVDAIVATARELGLRTPPRRRPGPERCGRLRCPGGADRGPVRHGHALSLEGPRLPARRADRRLGRADGAKRGA